jgi:hypothetical protein
MFIFQMRVKLINININFSAPCSFFQFKLLKNLETILNSFSRAYYIQGAVARFKLSQDFM